MVPGPAGAPHRDLQSRFGYMVACSHPRACPLREFGRPGSRPHWRAARSTPPLTVGRSSTVARNTFLTSLLGAILRDHQNGIFLHNASMMLRRNCAAFFSRRGFHLVILR